MIDAAIQPLCEQALKSSLAPIEEQLTVERWSEHRINDDTASRSVTWMTRGDDGVEFRMDCVLQDGEEIPVIWLLNAKTNVMKQLELQLVPLPEKKPEMTQVIEQAEDQQQTVGWRSWFWRW